MVCDVCGTPMVSERVGSGPGEEVWCCPWCFAFTYVGGEYFAVCRPPYLPVRMRWERAVADGLADRPVHAYGAFRATLCGITRMDLSASAYPWPHRWESACVTCREAAEAVDARWPAGMRHGEARASVRNSA
ncbi:hypothetical protein [Embleya sp. NPDC059237]|uniref:hypothetical protein n=1 Tax=Embleya sp. NPDC059237 TaxID=3346784 RepID=UPI0036A64BA8